MTPPPPSPRAPGGFCQQCGKALDLETRRTVGQAVFCEPCLEARLESAPYPPPAPFTPTPRRQASLHPWVAGLLGFIPGVGAMYNEQYAKGIAHLTIFALLGALADANGALGIFVAGWIFYMAIEAYHTAVARRDGLPLPDPFGLNDLGDRLGFSQGWQRPKVPPTPASAEGYRSPMPNGPRSVAGQPAGYESWQEGSPQTPPSMGYRPVEPTNPAPPWFPARPNDPLAPNPTAPAPDSTLAGTSLEQAPLGAILLILLGLLFLLSSSRRFHEVAPESLLGLGLVGLAGWIFLSRFRPTDAGPLFRLQSALQPAVWVLTTGLLTLLDASGILRWGRSWPVFLITAGLVTLLRRAAAREASRASAPPPPVGYPR